jgi:uncharacterized membrane protein
MRKRVRVAGEPVNPMLGLLALGIFANVVLFDLAAVVSGFAFFGIVAFWSMLAGLVAALPGAASAVVDMLKAPVEGTVRGIVSRYGLADVLMVGVFAVVWLGRLGGERAGSGWYLLAEVAAFGVGVAGMWAARELIGADEPPADSLGRRSVMAAREALPPRAAAGSGLATQNTVRLRNAADTVRLRQPARDRLAVSFGSSGSAVPAARAAQSASSAIFRASPSRPS